MRGELENSLLHCCDGKSKNKVVFRSDQTVDHIYKGQQEIEIQMCSIFSWINIDFACLYCKIFSGFVSPMTPAL